MQEKFGRSQDGSDGASSACEDWGNEGAPLHIATLEFFNENEILGKFIQDFEAIRC